MHGRARPSCPFRRTRVKARRGHRRVAKGQPRRAAGRAAAHVPTGGSAPHRPPSAEAEADPKISIKRSELKLACAFVTEVTTTFKTVRQYLRANPTVRAQGCLYPEYTPNFERMVALVERFRGALGHSR